MTKVIGQENIMVQMKKTGSKIRIRAPKGEGLTLSDFGVTLEDFKITGFPNYD